MKGLGQLTLTQIRLFMRNRQALFWSFFLPIFMMVLLGGIIGGGGGFSLYLAVTDEDLSPLSSELIGDLADQEGLALTEVPRADGLKRLENGDADMLLVIPAGFGDRIGEKGGDGRADVELYFDEANPQVAEIGVTLVEQVIDQWNKSLVAFTPLISLNEVNVQSHEVSYIAFLVPGIVALLIMSNNLNGVAATISSWRERGILRRLQGTPLRSSTFVASQIIARILFNSLQIIVVLLVALFAFNIQNHGSWWLMIVFIVLGNFTFMAIGFIIASMARNTESVSPLAGLLSFFMIFLGGIFFPIRDLPIWLAPLIKVIPISYLADALRAIMTAGAGLNDLWLEGLVLFLWLIGAFAVSVWTFRWEEA